MWSKNALFFLLSPLRFKGAIQKIYRSDIDKFVTDSIDSAIVFCLSISLNEYKPDISASSLNLVKTEDNVGFLYLASDF